MNLEDFKLYNRQNNKNLPLDPYFKADLPSPDTIYYKDFHFLDEPLINRKYPPKVMIKASSSVETPPLGTIAILNEESILS